MRFSGNGVLTGKLGVVDDNLRSPALGMGGMGGGGGNMSGGFELQAVANFGESLEFSSCCLLFL